MKNIVTISFVVFFAFISKNTTAQIIQKQANKKQLIKGETLTPIDNEKNLIKIQPTSIKVNASTKNIISKNKKKKEKKKRKYGNKNSVLNNSTRKHE